MRVHPDVEVARDSQRRKLSSTHIFKQAKDAERARVEVGVAIYSKSLSPVMCFLQHGNMSSNMTLPKQPTAWEPSVQVLGANRRHSHSNLQRKEGFILVHSSGYSSPWQGNCVGTILRQLVMLHLDSGHRIEC